MAQTALKVLKCCDHHLMFSRTRIVSGLDRKFRFSSTLSQVDTTKHCGASVFNARSISNDSSKGSKVKPQKAEDIEDEKQPRFTLKDTSALSALKTEESDQSDVTEVPPESVAQYEFFRQRDTIRKRRKEILKMDEKDWEDTWVMKKDWTDRPTLGEVQVNKSERGLLESGLLEFMNSKSRRQTLTFLQQDIDWRFESWVRWYERRKEDQTIEYQMFNPKRNQILGNELAAAHFFLYRKCPVKFLGADKWVDKYRIDEEAGKEEEDLPYMQFDLCSLPTRYDPNYVLEAVDASNFPDLRYEGLENLANLRHVKHLKLAGCIHLDAWCIDRLASYFENTLKYLDISGCTGFSEGALCGLARFKKLETLVVKDMPQVTNREIIFAMLEEMNPKLKIIGNDYETKLNELIRENEMLDKKAQQAQEVTITVEPRSEQPSSNQNNPDYGVHTSTP